MDSNDGKAVDVGVRGAMASCDRNFLIPASVLASCLLGLAFGLTRFISVLRADLKVGGVDWPGALLLLGMIGSVAILILLGCAAVGIILGTILSAIVRRNTPRKLASAR